MRCTCRDLVRCILLRLLRKGREKETRWQTNSEAHDAAAKWWKGKKTKQKQTNSKAHDGAAKSGGVGKRPRGVERDEREDGGGNENCALVPKRTLFYIASEREEVEHAWESYPWG